MRCRADCPVLEPIGGNRARASKCCTSAANQVALPCRERLEGRPRIQDRTSRPGRRIASPSSRPRLAHPGRRFLPKPPPAKVAPCGAQPRRARGSATLTWIQPSRRATSSSSPPRGTSLRPSARARADFAHTNRSPRSLPRQVLHSGRGSRAAVQNNRACPRSGSPTPRGLPGGTSLRSGRRCRRGRRPPRARPDGIQ